MTAPAGAASDRDGISARLSVAIYDVRVMLRKYHVPLVPKFLNRASVAFFGVNIDDHVAFGEGLRLPGGNVVIGGFTTIGRRATIGPYVAIGTRAGSFDGPTIGDDVTIGANTTILGAWQIGDGVIIMPGSVVTHDVPAGTTVAGIPARPLATSGAPSLRIVGT